MQKRFTLQSAQNGNANGNNGDLSEIAAVAMQVDTSGFTGTVNFEGSMDSTNWYSVPLLNSSGVYVSTTTAAGMFVGSSPYPLIRARTSGVSAGTVTVTVWCKGYTA